MHPAISISLMMCLSIPISKHSSRRSQHDPKPEPHGYNSKHRNGSLADFHNAPAHLERQNRHQSSSQDKPYNYHHRSKLPELHRHIQIPKYDSTRHTPSNHASKTITIPAHITAETQNRKNSSSTKQQPHHPNKKCETHIKVEDCPKTRPRADTCQHDRTKAANCQFAQSKTEKSLLNNQGVPIRLILPTNLVPQVQNPQCSPQPPTTSKKTKEMHSPALHNPNHARYEQRVPPASREISEPRQIESLRWARKQEDTTLLHSSRHEVEMSNEHRHHLPSSSSLPFPIGALPAPHRQHRQYWCSICSAADTGSVAGKRCCTCKDDGMVRGGGGVFGFGR